jgi:protein phosphatase
VIVAVADGMGGHVAGEIASKLAIETATVKGDMGVADRVQAANQAVYLQSLENPELAGMGTTLTIAEATDDRVSIGHVGDSRCYVLRDGELRLLTVDHTVANEYVAAGRISAEEAAQHPQRHVLTRALGLQEIVEVDIYEEPLEPGDRLLLCSDGLNGMISDTQIRDIAGEGAPEEAVWALIERANLAGGYDNVTVVIVDVAE